MIGLNPLQGHAASDEKIAPLSCEALSRFDARNTTIDIAKQQPAGAFSPPQADPFGAPPDFSKLPAFCRIAGSIKPTTDSNIRFELWLPSENWNGRFMQTGNGGAAGTVLYAPLTEPLSRGYAVSNTDTGHEGQFGEFTWVPDHPERLIDYQHRAVHELTVVGKAISATYYGRSPEKAYWFGCSTGGRQGLKEAQRYPNDYDAIIAGAPANNWSPLLSLTVVIERNLGVNGLPLEKLPFLRSSSVVACDPIDGVTDGVISEPGRCGFDPARLQCAADETATCLSSDEVAAAQRIYAGLIDANGDILIPGTGPGSEMEWAAYGTDGFRIGSSYYRNVIMKDPDWDPASFDLDRDLPRAEAFDAGAAKAMDPDLSAFVGRGGKLLMYHGTTDGLIPYGNSVRYFESVQETLGNQANSESAKLFLVPGMDHCAGGAGAHQVDWLSAMEQWVEKGETPDQLLATNPGRDGQRGFTRPVCSYPRVAKYKGAGDAADAANFICAMP